MFWIKKEMTKIFQCFGADGMDLLKNKFDNT